jgi:hypothetical protein
VLPPSGILHIPADRLREALLEAVGGPPTELVANLTRIDRVAAIMPRAVGNKANQVFSFAKQTKESTNEFDVSQLGSAPNVVDLPRPSPLKHREQSFAMVLDMEPVAHVGTVPVDRKRLLMKRMSFSGNW